MLLTDVFDNKINCLFAVSKQGQVAGDRWVLIDVLYNNKSCLFNNKFIEKKVHFQTYDL